MKRFLILLFTVLCFSEIHAEMPKALQEQLLSGNTVGSSSQGYEFFIAIPPNETAGYPYGELEVYVASTKPTEVSLMYGSSNALISKKTINVPMGVVVFSNKTGEMDFLAHEIRTPETVLDKGLRIVSDKNPVSVYVLNSKVTTSDGYMAIPTSSWGQDYIHVCYYDNSEGFDPRIGLPYFGGGFIVVASENNTRVEIALKGVGADLAGTTSGKQIGDSFEVMLNKGQVYLVQGDGETDGYFDLTGTRITSDKPVGLISYHQRCDMPAYLQSSRDHLSEMMPPVPTWGKKYATIEFKRNNKGDLFRIVAAEDSTDYKLVWYDFTTNEVLGQRTGTLIHSGDFAEIIEVMHYPGVDVKSVRGMSVFEANKPILVMHYSFSSSWDGANNFDPFMLCVSSIDQFTKTTVFQTPNEKFVDNNFNLIAVGDTNDAVANEILLKSILIDGKPVYLESTNLLTSRIPGTNLYWATVKVSTGAHYVTGDTPFGGYIYGYTSVDSYGWPAAMAINDKSSNDIVKPIVNVQQSSTNTYRINFSEESDGKSTGVSMRPTLLAGSRNFSEPQFETEFKAYPPTHTGYFTLSVLDESLDAVAYFSIMDRAGNEKIDSIIHVSTSINSDDSNDEIKIFPIPANDFITISGDDLLGFKHGRIIDELGNTIKSFTQEEIRKYINIREFPQGAYMLIIDSNNGVITKKFTVSR